MTEQVITSIVGGAAFSVAAVASYLQVMRHVTRARPVALGASLVALLSQIGYWLWALKRDGLIGAMANDLPSAVLMSALIGLMGFGTLLSGRLKGVEGFLFVVAAVLSFAHYTLKDEAPVDLTHRPWFISHALAFALSAVTFVAGGVAGISYLLVTRMLRKKRAIGLVGSVAPLESLERFGRWMPVIGFPLFTFGILTGLCGVAHRKDLSSIAWYLDPTFVLSVIAWAVYGYLSVASLYGPHIRGRRAAMLSTYGLGLIVVVFFVREFSSRLHQ
jgi:ABC-type uncharacterized transport system permease subunit